MLPILSRSHFLSRPHFLSRLLPTRSLTTPPTTTPPTTSPILAALAAHPPTKVAITDSHGTHTYASLLSHAYSLSRHLSPAPTAVFLHPNAAVATSLLAIWAAGGIAVPLSPLYPAAALEPLLHTIPTPALITSPSLRHALPPLPATTAVIDIHHATPLSDPPSDPPSAPAFQPPSRTQQDAIVFFTSGTTATPKGVIWTHSMLRYQLATLSSLWRCTSHDRLLNVLPLHHIHGMVNVLLSALYNGAHIEMHPAFDAHSVWHSFRAHHPPTVFMAVPAVYGKLVRHYDAATEWDRRRMRDAAAKLRLFVCGSATLSKKLFDRWQQISGHSILERYGMTETGMTLSNDYDHRVSGMLGIPLPGVDVRLDQDGQLLVKGPGVFTSYWGEPEKTKQSFQEGWFLTGDIVNRVNGLYKLQGRACADIIKTAGYKVSSLEIEDLIRDVDGVFDCSVVGVQDDVLGEQIVAALIVDREHVVPVVQAALESALPRYKRPRRYFVVQQLPRNILGKVQKHVLKLRLPL